MSEPESAAMHERSLAKGIVAGLIGGLAGTLARTFAERMFPPHAPGETQPHELAADEIHWGFGAAAGAAYGALAEYYPGATSKEGAGFGMVLETLTHESALPALGFSAEAEGDTVRERASEMTSDVVFGVATEMVRKFVRKLL